MALRVSTSYHSPRIAVPMNWGTGGTVFQNGGGTNPFSLTTQDPNSLKFPVWFATGRAGIDGNFTVALTSGFTPPINLVAWEWNRTANAWVKLGPNNSLYQTTYDATYAQNVFQASENSYILIQSSAAVTGTALMDGMVDNIIPPAAQEG